MHTQCTLIYKKISNQLNKKIIPPLSLAVVDQNDLKNFILNPREEKCLSPRASKKRIIDFKLGRAAARKALNALQINDAVILKGKNREPVWPPGVTGSITHKNGIGIAVVASRTMGYKISGLGIDLEIIVSKYRQENFPLYTSGEELKWINEADSLKRFIMLCSAKEAVFKLINSLYNLSFRFKEVKLLWHAGDSAFHYEIKQKQLTRIFHGLIYCFECDKYVFSICYKS
ncbi:MAG: 4'-phosphopantetheinyl transferase superfamily protein [Spirochaetales bacterium]|nr:4'-phosphopantetheinyl transferase superfamily protein [Spirochaetales bacterium]